MNTWVKEIIQLTAQNYRGVRLDCYAPFKFAMLFKSGHSGFMGYGDLWGFILQNQFILNPCLDLRGFMGNYGKLVGDISERIYGNLWNARR